MGTNLSENNYWNSLYKGFSLSGLSNKITSFLNKVPFLQNYAYYLLWKIILPKHLHRDPSLCILEVGSAPGYNLIDFHNKMGFNPFGVEYTSAGAAINRKLFELHNIDARNLIQNDFLSEDFLHEYANSFDIVSSFGFIEHFDDPGDIVQKHLRLLKKGGILIVQIPNLSGFNYRLSHFFNKEVLDIHNLSIMNEESFKSLFNSTTTVPLFCNYYGTFNFGLYNAKGWWRVFLLKVCNLFQLLLNVFFRLFLGSKGSESKNLSPYLLYIGRKPE
jgi:SAM-dependent methyltransferase